MRLFRWGVVMSITLALLLSACGQDPPRPPGGDPESNGSTSTASEALDDKVRIDVQSITPSDGGKHVWVAYKATNTASKVIVRAKATISVLDADGTDIGSKSRYVISSDDGGVAPGASLEKRFIIPVSDPQKAASARFTLEVVRGG